MKAAIVVPTVRKDCIIRFLDSWGEQFQGHLVIVVEDNPVRSFPVSGSNVVHCCWADIDRALGEQAWIIPRRSGCIRSFGCYLAMKEPVDMIVTLDDDCLPRDTGFLETHYAKLTAPAVTNAWVSTIDGLHPRGMPYRALDRHADCVINHGLWTNVPDLDAITQLHAERTNLEFQLIEQVIPRGSYFSLSSMNVAFKPEAAPAMYFLPMGQDWKYDRFGDIWCGLFAKKISDHLGKAVRSGEPSVQHLRASNVWTNLEKEMSGYEVNETLWQKVDGVVLTATNFRDAYLELAQALPLEGDYWSKMREAMCIWARLLPDADHRTAKPRRAAAAATIESAPLGVA